MAALLLGLFLVLAQISPSPAADLRACVPGTSVACDDKNPCTADHCENLVCVHTPATGPACDDHNACTEHDHCEAGKCVGTPITCADDGFSCTDDVCLGGRCTHVPVDSRCVTDDACTKAVCAPGRAARDGTGCAPGPPEDDGQECAEDGDACTADVCAGGLCAHEPVEDWTTCTAVEGAFRQALALASAARGLQTVMSPSTPVAVLTRLAGIYDTLEGISRILSGKTGADATPGPPRALMETPLRRRARLALGVLARVRPQLFSFVRTVRGTREPAATAAVLDIRRRARLLVRWTRALRAELRRLLAVRSTFVQ